MYFAGRSHSGKNGISSGANDRYVGVDFLAHQRVRGEPCEHYASHLLSNPARRQPKRQVTVILSNLISSRPLRRREAEVTEIDVQIMMPSRVGNDPTNVRAIAVISRENIQELTVALINAKGHDLCPWLDGCDLRPSPLVAVVSVRRENDSALVCVVWEDTNPALAFIEEERMRLSVWS